MVRACSKCRRLFPAQDKACSEDGAPLVPVRLTELSGALADRFPHPRPFARGGTGTLYRIEGEPERILKLFDRDALGSDEERAQLERELGKQPGVLEQGREGALSWVLREFVPGESLAARLYRQRVL
ncbi:MAG TPA: hypothetical protein VJR89_21760, partial [Polyangiales bacterium]|nr:hypothetical protein [Polyangiales bacterium]